MNFCKAFTKNMNEYYAIEMIKENIETVLNGEENFDFEHDEYFMKVSNYKFFTKPIFGMAGLNTWMIFMNDVMYVRHKTTNRFTQKKVIEDEIHIFKNDFHPKIWEYLNIEDINNHPTRLYVSARYKKDDLDYTLKKYPPFKAMYGIDDACYIGKESTAEVNITSFRKDFREATSHYYQSYGLKIATLATLWYLGILLNKNAIRLFSKIYAAETPVGFAPIIYKPLLDKLDDEYIYKVFISVAKKLEEYRSNCVRNNTDPNIYGDPDYAFHNYIRENRKDSFETMIQVFENLEKNSFNYAKYSTFEHHSGVSFALRRAHDPRYKELFKEKENEISKFLEGEPRYDV